MTPGARLAAQIECLEAIEDALKGQGQPADQILQAYFRGRRYAGSKDRRAVREATYRCLRRRGLLSWLLDQAGLNGAVTGRALVIAETVLDRGDLGLFQTSDPHGPAPLDPEEAGLAARLATVDPKTAPARIQNEVPSWAEAGLARRFSDMAMNEAEALLKTAGLDIRVNRLKTQSLDLDLAPLFGSVPGVPDAFTRSEPLRLDGHDAYRSGRIEIQDRAAQVASRLVAARPGMQIVDLCAGAGGKSLAVGAEMENRGQIHAFDTSSRRLKALKERANRAKLHAIQAHTLPRGVKSGQAIFDEVRGRAERVILDVPCSGVGTWRRAPDLRWRMTGEQLERYCARQTEILALGADLVKPGGRLLYMTCSLLPEENEDIVDQFLSRSGGRFHRLDYRAVWTESGLDGDAWPTCALNPLDLCLTPATHGSDGFFISVLEHIAA